MDRVINFSVPRKQFEFIFFLKKKSPKLKKYWKQLEKGTFFRSRSDYSKKHTKFNKMKQIKTNQTGTKMQTRIVGGYAPHHR